MHRLLLVDDEPRNLSLLAAILAPLNHELVRASTGRDALAILAHDAIDLVLLDLRMPGLDGIEVLTALRAREIATRVPVILVTASSDREDRLRGLRAGADDYIEKPIDGALLLVRVRTLLDLKSARDAVEARNVALEELQRNQRELTEMLVHDLKTPLTAVRLTFELLTKGEPIDAAELLSMAQDGDSAAARLQAMVEELLLVARLERADLPIRPVPLVLSTLFAGVAGLHRRAADARHIQLFVTPEADVTVSADRDLLARVLDNLVSNAIRHTPTHGRIGLSARRVGGIEITVSNTGRPIPMADRVRVFDKFWSGPPSRGSSVNVGMGLYFCRRAIEAHGGRIDVSDLPEWPTTIRVQMPA